LSSLRCSLLQLQPFAANNVPVALTQAERPYPLEPLALPANLITGTPEQCAALPDPQQPENTECVRKRGKGYAERLAQWLKERPNGELSDTLKP
jgi:hypothetical protein